MSKSLFSIGLTKSSKRKVISAFNSSNEPKHTSKEIPFEGPHLLTIAPTGSGKGVSAIIPTLLTYRGPIISIDPKGEQVAVVKRAREAMGHKVAILDPFQITNYEGDKLNPMDISCLSNFDQDVDCYNLAHIISGGSQSLSDPYWDNSARSLIAGVISASISVDIKKNQTIGILRSRLCNDPDYGLALLLDNEKSKLTPATYDAIASYLATPSDKTRPSITSTAVSYFSSLFSKTIDKFLSETTFDINDIVEGKPLDIFIVFPPDKLTSHSRLLQLILNVFFKALFSRKQIPREKTMIILDECAALGKFDPFISMLTLGRGYGSIIHSIWQDMNQMKTIYGDNFRTILNNSNTWMFFGITKYMLAVEIASITGIPAADLLNMSHDELLIINDNEVHFPAKKMNYLNDKKYNKKFDVNPFYANHEL